MELIRRIATLVEDTWGCSAMRDYDGAAFTDGRLRLSEGLAYGVVAVLSAVMAVVRAPLYSHWFDPSAYGEFALVSAGSGLLSSIILAVFSNVLCRHYDRERRAGRLDAFVSTLAAGTGGGLVLAGLVAWTSSPWLGLQGMGAPTWLILLTGIATVQGLVRQVNRMEHQVAAFVVGRLVDPLWQLGSPLLLFSFGMSGFPALASATGTAGVGSLLVAGAWAWPILRRVKLARTSSKALRAAFAYGLPLAPLALAGWVITSSNRYVIHHFLGSEATGVFSMGYSLASLPIGLFSGVLVMTIGPVVWERLNVQGSAQALCLARRTSTLFLAVAIPSALGLGLLADRIVRVFFSAAYGEVGVVILPIALGSVLAGLYSFLIKPWELHESTRSVPLYVGAGAAVNLATNIWLVPRFGIVGAACGSLIAHAVVAVAMAVGGRRLYGARVLPGWRDMASIMGGCAAMGVGLAALSPTLSWGEESELAFLIIAGAVTYFVAFVSMGWALKSELLAGLRSVGLHPPAGVRSDCQRGFRPARAEQKGLTE